jgi:hypothetical protein
MTDIFTLMTIRGGCDDQENAAKPPQLEQTGWSDMSGSECKPDAKRERDSAKQQARAQPSRNRFDHPVRAFNRMPSAIFS